MHRYARQIGASLEIKSYIKNVSMLLFYDTDNYACFIYNIISTACSYRHAGASM